MSKSDLIESDCHECPLCMEPFELDDINFYPCGCGYQICRFCWHRIKTDESGLCPACRQPYTENPAEYTPLTQEQITKLKQKKKTKNHEKKQKQIENRKNLSEVRVVQKNLVFVVGLSKRLADTEVLKKPEYFGKFGKIQKIVINTNTVYHGPQGPSVSAYVTYLKSEDASKAIQAVNNAKVDGRMLKVSFGTTKYCSNFLKGASCPKTDCMYLHELGEEEASFTKEDMAQGKHQLYESATLSQSTVTKEVVNKETNKRPNSAQNKVKEQPKTTIAAPNTTTTATATTTTTTVATPHETITTTITTTSSSVTQSALPASASWASRTTQCKDVVSSPPKSTTPYLPPSTHQSKGHLVPSPTLLEPTPNQNVANGTKNRQSTPDNSPQRQVCSPNLSKSPNSIVDLGSQVTSPTRSNRTLEGDLDTLSPVTPTHSTGSSPPEATLHLLTQANNLDINLSKQTETTLQTDTSCLTTMYTDRNASSVPSFTLRDRSFVSNEFGTLGTAWGKSEHSTEQPFQTSQQTESWDYLRSNVPLTSDTHLPLHRSSLSDLSIPSHQLGLDIPPVQSTVTPIKTEETNNSIKGTEEQVESLHSSDDSLLHRRASLGNIRIGNYGQDTMTHSMQNLKLGEREDTSGRMRAATNTLVSPTPGMNMYQDNTHPSSISTPLDRRNSIDTSLSTLRTPFENIELFHSRPLIYPTPQPIKHSSYLHPSNNPQTNSTHFSAPNNGRQGMELHHNREFDMMGSPNFTPLVPHLDEWFPKPLLSQDTWNPNILPPTDGPRVLQEKHRLPGGRPNWSMQDTEIPTPAPPGFNVTSANSQQYTNRTLTHYPMDPPKQMIGPFQQTSQETLYHQRNAKHFPTNIQLDPPYPTYPHSNAYHMLPRDQSCPLPQRMECHQPLIYQNSHELDAIDTISYKNTPNQRPNMDFVYTKQVKNRPKQIPTNRYPPKYGLPQELGYPRFEKSRISPFMISSFNSDPNLATNENLFPELNDTTQYTAEYK